MANLDEFVDELKNKMRENAVTYIPNPRELAEKVVKDISGKDHPDAHSSMETWNEDYLHIFFAEWKCLSTI